MKSFFSSKNTHYDLGLNTPKPFCKVATAVGYNTLSPSLTIGKDILYINLEEKKSQVLTSFYIVLESFATDLAGFWWSLMIASLLWFFLENNLTCLLPILSTVFSLILFALGRWARNCWTSSALLISRLW